MPNYRLQDAGASIDVAISIPKGIVPYFNYIYDKEKEGAETKKQFLFKLIKQIIQHKYNQYKAQEDAEIRKAQLKADQTVQAAEMDGIF